ncbi:MAG: GNAT family N-acetyltransferase [Bacillota bacterium]
MEIREITESDIPILRRFTCGNESMDCYLKNEAYKFHIYGEGITKLLVDDDDKIIGYYTLKASEIVVDDPEMYDEPRHIPAIEISRIAIVKTMQRQGLGRILMGYIIKLIVRVIAKEIGCRYISLHALRDLVDWYKEEFGFEVWDDTIKDDQETVFMYLDILSLKS